MRDLIVITADADMKAVMEVVLERVQSLGIRKIDAEVQRHDGRDAGMVKDGPDLSRRWKDEFEHLVLLWDHQGSGRERVGPDAAAREVQSRLDWITWRGRSLALALDPELEEWIWRSPDAVRKWLEHKDDTLLNKWLKDFASSSGTNPADRSFTLPKERLEYVSRRRWERHPRPHDYRQLAKLASLANWRESPTFGVLATWLVAMFPLVPEE